VFYLRNHYLSNKHNNLAKNISSQISQSHTQAVSSHHKKASTLFLVSNALIISPQLSHTITHFKSIKFTNNTYKENIQSLFCPTSKTHIHIALLKLLHIHVLVFKLGISRTSIIFNFCKHFTNM
jgi:hypothetical protein